MAQARGRKAGKGRWRRWLWRIPLLFVAVTVLQVAVLRFVDPPFSAFMAARQLEAWAHGDWGFRIAHDWRDLRAMAPSLPLALVAAEDQNFPSHHGFDFDAIAKAQAHNERVVARAEKRGRPVRGIRGVKGGALASTEATSPASRIRAASSRKPG